ncbi:MAG: response regulator [Bdellovibrionales bacterium]|nr:response regulator [Bdellovibrionales bacterium]
MQRIIKDTLRGKTILVVDDEDELRDMLSEELEFSGCQTRRASGGREALEIIRQGGVDAIITDIRMPKGDGIELLQNLHREDPTHPPVIFVTGFEDISEGEARTRGAFALFTKPVHFQRILEAATQALNNAFDKCDL